MRILSVVSFALLLASCASTKPPPAAIVAMAASNTGLDELDVQGAGGVFAPDPEAPQLLELGLARGRGARGVRPQQG